MSDFDTDVLIVGAGSAGTMLALELARFGVDARSIDRLAAPAKTSKAITVHARTLEIFQRIDPDLIDRFLRHGIENKGYVLHFVNETGNRREVRPGLDFTTLDSPYPFLLVHGQSDTERFLREYLFEKYDRRTEWGTECTGVSHTSDGVEATLTAPDGTTEVVRCRYLVACDGMNSGVRRSLALEQSEQTYAGTMMQNMDVFLNGFPDVEDYVHYCAGTDHFIMIVKLPGGFFRLLLSDRGEAADPSVPPKRAFSNLIDQHFDGVELGEIVWHSKWDSRVRLAKTYRERRVFLAGDSAHVHSTTGGQGMNCCIQDAYNLGWKLGMVLNDLAPESLLDSYETERRPIAEQVIWAASSLHDVFMGHGRSIDERAERMNDPGFLDAVVGHCSGVDYTYADETGHRAPGAALRNGDRLIDGLLDDGRTLFEATRSQRFAVVGLYTSDTEATAIEANLDRIRKRFARAVDTIVLPASAEIARRYSIESGGLVLAVRPDGYVGLRCEPRAVGDLDHYLETQLY